MIQQTIAYVLISLLLACNVVNPKQKFSANETPSGQVPSEIVKKKETLSAFLRKLDMTQGRKTTETLCQMPPDSIQVYPTESSAGGAAGSETSGQAMVFPGEKGVVSTASTTIIPTTTPVISDNSAPTRCIDQMIAYENNSGEVSQCTPVKPGEPIYKQPQFCGDRPQIELELCVVNDSLEIKQVANSVAPSKGICTFIACSFFDDNTVIASGSVAKNLDYSTASASNTSSVESDVIKVPYANQHGRFECRVFNPKDKEVPPTDPTLPPGETPPSEPPILVTEKCPSLAMPDLCKNETVSFICEVTIKGTNGSPLPFSSKGESTCGVPFDQRQDVYKQACESKLFNGDYKTLANDITCRSIK